MSLADQIQSDLTASMKARDKTRTATLRSVLAGIKNLRAESGHGADVSDEEVQAIIDKEAKKRRESLETYGQAGRDELVAAEQAELDVLEAYLPEPLSEDELSQIVRQTIDEVGATDRSDMGKVMGALMPKVKGRADGKVVNRMVSSELAGS